MKIDELIRDLKYTVLHLPWSEIRKDADEVVARVEAALEAQQGRIAQLEAELKEEMYRHDRVQDFEVAEAQELAQYRTADKEGRLFVLPCKVGDTVFVNGELRTVECMIVEAYLDDKEGPVFLVTFDCDSDCKGCPFDSWHQDPSGEYSCDGEFCESSIKGSDFGKTAFLNREDAEVALSPPEVDG